MKAFFNFLIIYILYVYAGYPLFLVICSLFRKDVYLRKKMHEFCVTMFIPVYNEESVIKKKIENCLHLNYPKDKIRFILILDGCNDKTENIASSFVDQRLKIIKLKRRNGKAKALREAILKAKGDIYVFTDANAIYEENAINNLVRNFINDSIVGVCGNLNYNDCGLTHTSQSEGIYWKYENLIKKFESKLGTLITANGAIYAIRKEYFFNIDDDLADDLLVELNISSKGKRLIYEPEAKAYEVAPQEAKEEFLRRIRIVNQGIKASCRHADLILKSGLFFIFEYLSHKVLRWLTPFIMITAFIANAILLQSFIYTAMFVLQIIFYSLAVMGLFFGKKRMNFKLLNLPFYFCLLNAAALFGIFSAIFKKDFSTWEKAQSTR
jgi:cellulose synthase/poly-beta-1,6-N-acetylglucosamine synthase-like glycosyltransferase